MTKLGLSVRGFLLSFPMDWHLRRYQSHCRVAERHDLAAKHHRDRAMQLADRGRSILSAQEQP